MSDWSVREWSVSDRSVRVREWLVSDRSVREWLMSNSLFNSCN